MATAPGETAAPEMEDPSPEDIRRYGGSILRRLGDVLREHPHDSSEETRRKCLGIVKGDMRSGYRDEIAHQVYDLITREGKDFMEHLSA